jgi:hypothetical protein
MVGELLWCLFLYLEHKPHVHLSILVRNFHAKNFEQLWELPFLELTKLLVKTFLWQFLRESHELV